MDSIADNCRNLIKAIYNCDSMRDKEAKYYICVYDMLNSEQLVAVFSNYNWCARFFGCSKDYVMTSASKGRLRDRRYLLKKVEKIED